MDCKYRSILLRKIISMVKNWKEKKIPTFLQGKKSKVWDLHYYDIIDDSVSFITRQQKEHHWDFHLEFPTTHELKWSICNKAMQNNKVSDFQKKKNTTKFSRFCLLSVPRQTVPVCGQHSATGRLHQRPSPHLQDGPKHGEESSAFSRNQQFCLQCSDLPLLKLQENSSMKKCLAEIPSVLGWTH